MLSRARHRILSAGRRGVLQQQHRIGQGGRCLVTTPAARGRAGEKTTVEVNWDGGGWKWKGFGGSGRGSGSSNRRWPLLVALIAGAGWAKQAHELETQEAVNQLMQRCSFHIQTAMKHQFGETADVLPLKELHALLSKSLRTSGPTALPRLLDAGVIGVLLKGVGSSNDEVSALCYRMLHLLSFNVHVAVKMGNDPSFQATFVKDLARQLARRKASHAKHRADVRQQSDWNASPVTFSAEETEAGASIEPVVEVDRKGADNLHCALRILESVLKATRSRASFTDERQKRTLTTLPELLRFFLYGECHYEVVTKSDTGGKEASMWPVEWGMVADIAELLVNPRAPSSDRAGKVGQTREETELSARLSTAAYSALEEVNVQCRLRGTPWPRAIVLALAAVREGSAVNATPNRRVRNSTEPELAVQEAGGSVSTAVIRDFLAEQGARTTGRERWGWFSDFFVGSGNAQALNEPLLQLNLPGEIEADTATTDPARTISFSKALWLAFTWGMGRRVVATHRAGEGLTFFFPITLLLAGTRAVVGMTALVNTHGPAGEMGRMPWDDSALPKVLDASSGSTGTTAMTGMRLAADLGYLYMVLFLCPYAFVPAVVVQQAIAMVVDHDHGSEISLERSEPMWEWEWE